jgi:Uma2 family endonuclease
MTALSQPLRPAPTLQLTPEDVERASYRDGKRYELLDGELKEKIVGAEALFVASRISERLNASQYPQHGFAACEVMVYCFERTNRGRKPDVVFARFDHLPDRRIPKGDLHFAPELVVEVLSPGNSGIEVEEKLNEYLEAGVLLVWIVNPDRRTIRIYRHDDYTRLYHEKDVIENESILPGLHLIVGEVFPAR